MTGENRRANAADEVQRADACWVEARTLRAAGLAYGAASRAYFAVFHVARAALYGMGLDARSHRAVVTLFGEHFVRSGRVAPELGRVLSHLQRDREDADYSTAAYFTDEQAAQMIADAERFVAAVRGLLPV